VAKGWLRIQAKSREPHPHSERKKAGLLWEERSEDEGGDSQQRTR
jgi:hypothetical protein